MRDAARRWPLWLAALSLLALAALRLAPHAPLRAQLAMSSAVFDDQGQLLRLALAQDQQYRLWTPLDQVSPQFVEALLLHEDRHFYWHPGVNPLALLRAARATYGGGARQGGSTLTMQLARLLYGLETRRPAGKLHQMLAALWLEARYSKRELLEAEINLLPYGGNVQGVGAASLVYFGRTPDRLSLAEALALVVMPQAPARRTPRGDEPAALRAARLRLYARWCRRHADARDTAALMRQPLRYGTVEDLPFSAPQLTSALLQAAPPGSTLRSTLNRSLQRTLERQIGLYVERQRRLGIRNAAALLVDARDMQVKASVGSANFFDDAIQGQVDGTQARRSPGSTLKPFLYALAFDQGLIHSQSMLKDAPTAFGPFSPENFDGRFEGPISAHDALIRSRNVPAVSLAARLSQPDLYDFLRSAGVSRMASREHYGLALALGGGELTMAELAKLYAMLAHHGLLRPLRTRLDDPLPAGSRLLSEAASWAVVDMLRDNPRPDDAVVAAHSAVAWKTGTSWGFRDAWTAGLFGPYVLVVWVGNFDGSGDPAFVGLQAAAPLFFAIVDALHAAHADDIDLQGPPPRTLARVDVCAASGELPNADCPRTVPSWFIPGRSPIRVSSVHRRLHIDLRTGRQACPPYDPRQVRDEVYEFWPSDLMRLFAQAGIPRRRPPPPGDCANAGMAGVAPQLSSPLNGVVYSLRSAQRQAGEGVPLQANADAEVRRLYWFVDEAYVGTTQPGVALNWLPSSAGRRQVRVVDDQGRADSRMLDVEFLP